MHNTDHLAQQQMLDGLLEEVGRLSVITRKLLLLSQADAGHLRFLHTRLDLSALLNEVLHDAPLLLEQQQLHCEIAPRLHVMGDAQLLTQVFNNLLTNATRHGQPHGWIRITAERSGEQVHVIFANDCADLPESKRQRFFDRFFRGEDASQRHPQGSGLGLSLAREIVRAHGGDLLLDQTALDVVQLRVTLPASLAQ